MKNVIDMMARRRSQIRYGNQRILDEAPVLDMVERRNEILLEERRTAKRTILSEFIGAFVVIPELGLQKVTIYDISEDGMSFDIAAEHGQFEMNQELALRVYLTQTTYFPIVVQTTRMRYIEELSLYRHGTAFVKELVQVDALHHFVKFVECVCSSLARDDGDIQINSGEVL